MAAASPFALTLSLLTAAVIGFGAGALIALDDDGDEPVAAATSSTPATSSSPPPAPTPTESTPGPTTPPPPGPTGVSLFADTAAIAPGQRINLNGQLSPPTPDVVLVVQRSIDGGEWQDFAGVTATTRPDGTFATYVQTSRAGANAFRVVGDAGGTPVESEPVVVTVG